MGVCFNWGLRILFDDTKTGNSLLGFAYESPHETNFFLKLSQSFLAGNSEDFIIDYEVF